MKKLLILLAIFFIDNLCVITQIKTSIYPYSEAFKEFPMLNKVNSEDIPLYKMPAFNLDSILQYEYDLDIKGVGRPFRFGYVFDADYGAEHGKWIELEDKNIWSIKFSSDKAYTLNFRFADLKLSYNAEMYVYNSAGTVVVGPITSKDNATEEFRTIGSDLIDGEEVIIQIIEPKEAEQRSSLKIIKVVHGFRNHYSEILSNKDKKGDSFQNDILDCHEDVACAPARFGPESRGVVRIHIINSTGAAWCSGALLNNQSGTNRPYFLTAHHCLDWDNNDVLSDFEKTLADSIDFAFNYKKATCNSNSIVSYVYYNYSGAHFRTGNWETDFALLESKDAIIDPEVRFLGWDALPTPISGMSSGFGIHHPKGDLMKASQDIGNIKTFPLLLPWEDHPNWSPRNSHLAVRWDIGATEGGSSGSPLFDQNHRVRGQLHGGFGGCSTINYAYYGALAVSLGKGLFDWLIPYPTGNLDDLVCNSTGPCQSITFENKTLTEDERIVCKNIILQNVTINSGATLLLQATESITLGPNVVLKTGGTLITEGRLLINSVYTVEAGASFVVK